MTTNNFFSRAQRWAKRGAAAAMLGAMSGLLVSCGGGGAAGSPATAGSLDILPGTGSLYANVPYLFTVVGGVAPYTVVSNEPTILPVNIQSLRSSTFTVSPIQPGVVDLSQDPNQVPSRKATLQVRDSAGAQISGTYDVLQNFLTGYGLSISTISSCSSGSTTTSTVGPAACAGAESQIRLVPVTNGVRFANKQMRLTVNYGAFFFVLDALGNLGGTIVTTADTAGIITVRIKSTASVPTQYAQFRLQDVVTGAYTDQNFVITNQASSAPLTTLPSAITLTGALTTQCGTGSTNVFIFGGQPPYTISTTNPNELLISPTTVQRSGDFFVLNAVSTQVCLGPGNVVVTDSSGGRATMSVTTKAGATNPPLPLTVSPSALCVPDGGTGVVLVQGGAGNVVINSSNPTLAVATPNSGTTPLVVTIATTATSGGAGGTLVPITVTDGGTTSGVTVTRKVSCP